MAKIWITSDTHFFDEKVLTQRPRFHSIDEMNSSIKYKWNKKIKKNDIVYHLGDFATDTKGDVRKRTLQKFFDSLNGRKWLIKGNHDEHSSQMNGWEGICDYKEIEIRQPSNWIILFHYPLKSWHRKSDRAWMLHGHTHGKLPHPEKNSLDVGVDNNEYWPLSIEQIFYKIKEQRKLKTKNE